MSKLEKIDIVESAKTFAKLVHKKQKYGNNKKYDVHLKHAVSVGKRHKVCKNVEAALWLHDTIEDQPSKVNFQTIKAMYGLTIANIVWNVTDEIGRNRKERKAKTRQKLSGSCNESKQTKLCDRIANIEASAKLESQRDREKISMYVKENKEFLISVTPNILEDGSDKVVNMIEEYTDLIKELNKLIKK